MLDTCICSFIMREQPEAVLKRLEQAVLRRHRIVVSAITYAEMRFGCTGKRPRRAMPNWSMHSVVAWMPCWLGPGGSGCHHRDPCRTGRRRYAD